MQFAVTTLLLRMTVRSQLFERVSTIFGRESLSCSPLIFAKDFWEFCLMILNYYSFKSQIGFNYWYLTIKNSYEGKNKTHRFVWLGLLTSLTLFMKFTYTSFELALPRFLNSRLNFLISILSLEISLACKSAWVLYKLSLLNSSLYCFSCWYRSWIKLSNKMVS